MNSICILSSRVMFPQYKPLFDQTRHYRTSHSELALYRWQYEDLNQWNYDNDGILSLASEIFKDLDNKDTLSSLSNHLFHMIMRMKRNLDVTDYSMARDFNVLLAICKSSCWFTEKQNQHFSFVDDGLPESNESLEQQLENLRSELQRSAEKLQSARRELQKLSKPSLRRKSEALSWKPKPSRRSSCKLQK